MAGLIPQRQPFNGKKDHGPFYSVVIAVIMLGAIFIALCGVVGTVSPPPPPTPAQRLTFCKDKVADKLYVTSDDYCFDVLKNDRAMNYIILGRHNGHTFLLALPEETK